MNISLESDKLVFIDCEYTSTHAMTTLISIALVTLQGEELYLTLNDYDRDQVSDWVRKNVLPFIDETKSISSKEACERISAFLEKYSSGKKITIVSAGKTTDHILLFQLWHTKYPELKYFSFERYLPDYLRHRAHYDLDTIFFMKGYNPNLLNREEFVEEAQESAGRKHNALYDANVVRKCYMKLGAGSG